jgi:hypothetical protein
MIDGYQAALGNQDFKTALRPQKFEENYANSILKATW